jgi:hypothetical protein
MPVDSFNDRTSAQGPVARTGSLTGSQPDGARPRATGTPAISQADGTAPLGSPVVTKSAPVPYAAPSGKGLSGKGRDWPAGVQSFQDDEV